MEHQFFCHRQFLAGNNGYHHPRPPFKATCFHKKCARVQIFGVSEALVPRMGPVNVAYVDLFLVKNPIATVLIYRVWSGYNQVITTGAPKCEWLLFIHDKRSLRLS